MSKKLVKVGVAVGGGVMGLAFGIWFIGARMFTSRFIGYAMIQQLSEEEIHSLVNEKGETIRTITCVALRDPCSFRLEGEWAIYFPVVLFPVIFGAVAYLIYAVISRKKNSEA